MKQATNRIQLMLGKVEQRHIRLGLAVITLVLFVIGAGAPSSAGTGG